MRTVREWRANAGVRRLLRAVRRARPLEEVLAALAPLNDAERKACLPELRRTRAAVRGEVWLSSALKAVYVAGAGCHRAPAATAQWLLGREFAWRSESCLPELLAALDGRPPEWYGDVAHRLAARPARAEDAHRLTAELARRSDGPPPATDGFVRGWVDHLGWVRPADRPKVLTDRLRTDPFLPYLLPRLFEVSGVGAPLNQFGWAEPLAELAANGTLDRAELLDATVSRLLRGESPGNLRFFRDLLALLAPDDEEVAARTTDWVRIAADAPSAAAKDAQRMLRRLWQAGRLGTEPLAEASRGVLFRSERTLVRSQLVLLGKALGRDRSAAPDLLPIVAEAFGHEDGEVQERALKLMARHVGRVDPALRKELAETVHLLGPSLRQRAAEVFGADVCPEPTDDGPYEELLPPPPEPRRMPPTPDLDELVEEVAVLAGDYWLPRSPVQRERLMDGLVRHAHRDHRALAAAVRPLSRRHHPAWEWLMRDRSHGLGPLVIAALGEVFEGGDRGLPVAPAHGRAPFEKVHRARVREAALGVAGGRVPLLLATPDGESGTLEPETLVDRLRTYHRLGMPPGDADFQLALLRVRADPGWAAAAAGVGSPAGERLAAWLAGGGAGTTVTERVDVPETVPERFRYPCSRPRRILAADGGLPGLLSATPAFAEPFRLLCAPHPATGGPEYRAETAEWLAVLPWNREAVAVRQLDRLVRGTTGDEREAAQALPALAEAGGEAGLAVHLAVGYGLGARNAEDRLAAVDALLVLAARGQLDAELLGRELGELLSFGTVKPNRLADALRSVATTGAYGTAWAVLRSLLPSVLAGGSGARGAGELLEVAADCVERCGASGTVAGVDAASVGSTRRAREARRLQAALRSAGP